MMTIGKAESTAWETTPPVADLQGAAERRGDGAGPAPHVEDGAIRAVADPDEPGVAGDTPGRCAYASLGGLAGEHSGAHSAYTFVAARLS